MFNSSHTSAITNNFIDNEKFLMRHMSYFLFRKTIFKSIIGINKLLLLLFSCLQIIHFTNVYIVAGKTKRINSVENKSSMYGAGARIGTNLPFLLSLGFILFAFHWTIEAKKNCLSHCVTILARYSSFFHRRAG